MGEIVSGVEVLALVQVLEEGFKDHGRLWVHAEAGERGRVVHIDGEWVTVRFFRTDTAADCHLTEVRQCDSNAATLGSGQIVTVSE